MIDWGSIEVIAVDFDGTILEKGVIPPETGEVIDRALARGVRFATASGRTWESQVEVLKKSDCGPETGRFAALTIDERDVWTLEDGDWTRLESWYQPLQQRWLELAPLAQERLDRVVAQLPEHGLAIDADVPPDMVIERGLVGVRTVDAAQSPQTAALLAEALSDLDELMVAYNYCWVHGLMRLAGKGNTLVALGEHWGLEPARILGVGDHMNDVSMLDGSTGLAAACVSNSAPEILEMVTNAGGYIAENSVSAGVREIIEQVIAAK